ncbi:MAG: S-layer homology domain-containing protein [Syntrophomonas sp.]|nr:S-layer homology domain-containing protein [Syntrophomonas sp.]
MYRYLTKILLSIVLAVSLICPAGLAAAYEVQTMPNVKAQMLQADYWINKISDPDRVILNPDQIEDFNQEIVRKLLYSVYKLADYPSSFTREQLTSFINYPFPTEPSYIGAEVVGTSYWQKLKQQMNLEGLQEKNQVKYGFTVKRSNLKIFPTADVIGDEPNDPAFDLFQNSSILAAEPVVILHHSRDEQWVYVQMYNCPGWLPAADVAVCDRDTWLDYQNKPDFLVVTGNRIRLDNDPLLPQISEMEFTMGTKLPLAKPEELPDSIRNRRVYQNYVVKLPVRNMSGQLEFIIAPIPISNDVSVGYLPYSRANIIRQAFKMQGERYCWGGMLNGRDCSALVLELYHCFGFRLARNSDAQEVSAGKTLTFDGYSVGYREKLLQSVAPGGSLHFPGHEMLYLGEDNGRYYVLNDLGSFAEIESGDAKPQSVRVRTVVINDLNIIRASGKRWIEVLTTAKLLEKSSFTDLANHPDRAIIESLADNYLVQGISAAEFNPEGKLTRAEFAVMLGRLLKLEPEQVEAQAQFTDVSDQWYAGAVGAVVKAGLFKGSDDNRFHPEAPLDRAQAAVILTQVSKNAVTGVAGEQLGKFSDQNLIPLWAKEAMNTVIERGLIKCKTPDTIAPLDLVTRSEAAVILDALLKMDVNREAIPVKVK